MAKIQRQNVPRRLQDAHKTAPEALRPPLGRHPDGPRCLQHDPKVPQEDPTTTPRRRQTPPRCHQDAPKTPSGRPKTPQDAPRRPKTPQDPSKTLPSQPKTPPGNDFGTILKNCFGRFLEEFLAEIASRSASSNLLSKQVII